MCVLHRCDNPPCCNPAHLFLGTHADNVRDKVNKGRQSRHSSPGEAAGLAKLTNEQVLEMRRLYAEEHIRQVDLAARFGVGQSAVSAILRRRTWSHI